MTYFFCFDILSLYLEQDTALPFPNKVESILQFSLKVTFVSSQDICQFTHKKNNNKQSTVLCYKYLTVAAMHSHLRKSVGLEKRPSFVITTQLVDNIQNNLLIFKITNAQL